MKLAGSWRVILAAIGADDFGEAQAAAEADQQDGAIAQDAQIVGPRGQHFAKIRGKDRLLLNRGPRVPATDARQNCSDVAVFSV